LLCESSEVNLLVDSAIYSETIFVNNQVHLTSLLEAISTSSSISDNRKDAPDADSFESSVTNAILPSAEGNDKMLDVLSLVHAFVNK
jgi:hypothetical protein